MKKGLIFGKCINDQSFYFNTIIFLLAIDTYMFYHNKFSQIHCWLQLFGLYQILLRYILYHTKYLMYQDIHNSIFHSHVVQRDNKAKNYLYYFQFPIHWILLTFE